MMSESCEEELRDDGAGQAQRLRLCIVTRESVPPDALVRFVRGPDGGLVADLAGKLPGRGVWVTLDREMVSRASRSGAFARSLKKEVRVPTDLAEEVERGLLRRSLAALSLANKAGGVVCGFAKVEAEIGRGGVLALVHARDGARDGIEKLNRRLISATADGAMSRQGVECFTNAELSLALGRSNVVHAALRNGGASQNFLKETGRLLRYRKTDPQTAGGNGIGNSDPNASGARAEQA